MASKPRVGSGNTVSDQVTDDKSFLQWVMLGLLVAVAVGCGTKKDLALYGERYEVDDIVLDGVTRFKKREFLKYLYIGETLWIPFTATYYFSEAQVPSDIERIVKLYQAYGYMDAEVTTFRILSKKRGKVDVLIRVREGTPIKIDAVTVSWDKYSDRRAPALRPEIDAKLHALKGAPLEIPTAEALIDDVVLSLKSRGFPLADVRVAVSETGARQVSLRFEVLPGPFAHIGDIRVDGLVNVPLKSVMTEAELAAGKPFSPVHLLEMEQRIFAMDVFSTVEISPGTEVVNGKIPVHISVTESKPQSIKVGVDLAVESTRWDQGVSALYTHRNLFGKMWRLDARLRVGYAELPSPFRTRAHGPIAAFSPAFTKKGLLEKKLVWRLAPSIELGIEEGYQYYTPGNMLGVSRLFGGLFLAEIAHHLAFYDFFRVSETLNANQTLLGLDYKDPYLLSYLEIKTVLYLTDRILDPKNGAALEFTYSVAGGPFGGHYDFHKLRPVVRGYWQVVDRVQLAFRAETGFIFPYGESPGAPFNLQFYLGGSDTVRGWGQRRLSPKTDNCAANEDDDCRPIPIGGKTDILANVEVRVRTFDKFFVAAFADMGDVQSGQFIYRPEEWNYTAGGGLRYDSPIGKLRLDVGFRLNDTVLSKGEPIFAFHFGLGEAF